MKKHLKTFALMLLAAAMGMAALAACIVLDASDRVCIVAYAGTALLACLVMGVFDIDERDARTMSLKDAARMKKAA